MIEEQADRQLELLERIADAQERTAERLEKQSEHLKTIADAFGYWLAEGLDVRTHSGSSRGY